MKAIVQREYGSPDVLQVAEIDRPRAGAGEVLLRVHAAGLDAGVWHLMTGRPYLVRLMGYGLRRPKHATPGQDVAGTVAAVGAGVTRFQRGDAVFGACRGAFAEYACARETALAPKPASLTFEQAATVPTSGVTALQALRDVARVRPGQQVLIIGAGGGVGTFAVQLARAFGAEVTGVCSAAKMDLVRAIGAQEAIDYAREDFADGRRRYDTILDTAGNRSLGHLRRALNPAGTLVIIGGEGGGRWLGGTDRLLRALLLSPLVRHRLRSLMATTRSEDLQLLGELIDAGEVAPILDRTYPLSGVPDAIRRWEAGHALGKTGIAVQPGPAASSAIP